MPQIDTNLIKIRLNEVSLITYLEYKFNKSFYNFYHEFAKSELNIDIDLKTFFDDVYNLVGIFYINYEKTPYETIDFFKNIFDLNQKSYEEKLLLTLKREIVYLICGFFTTQPVKDKNNNLTYILPNINDFFHSVWIKIFLDRQGSEPLIKIDGEEFSISDITDKVLKLEMDAELGDYSVEDFENWKQFFVNQYTNTSPGITAKLSNQGVWKINELQVVELGKAIFEQQKPKGITQANFLNNLGKLFNLNLTEKVQKDRLKTIKDRQGSQTKFIDELSGFLHTYLNK